MIEATIHDNNHTISFDRLQNELIELFDQSVDIF